MSNLLVVPLDPQIKALLDQMASLDVPPMWEMTPDQARASFTQMTTMMGQGEPVAEVTDRTIPGPAGEIPIRIFRPEVEGGEGAPLPVLVFYHGGGFVIGSIDTHDRDCRALANRAKAVVVSVEYRLAPEHPFPAAVDDCWAALRWVADHATGIGGDPNRLAVGGDSAGGNLAAVTALWARDNGIALRFQLLIYPGIDADGEYPSHQENQGYLLDREAIDWFVKCYLGEVVPDDWRLKPMLSESLAGVAPALVITAEFDPLRDEGEAYADALRKAGVDAKASRYDGMIHGFFGMAPFIQAAIPAVDEAGTALKAALHG